MCETTQVDRFEEEAHVLVNENVGPRLYEIVLEAPRTAQAVQPGQFIHMLIPGHEAHILRRPFSVYKADINKGIITILYQTVGQGTQLMTDIKPGEICNLMGTMGHGWKPVDGKILIVGGGVGAAPLFLFAEKLAHENHPFEVVLGAQTESMMVTRHDYAEILGHDPILATDDGSLGHHGFCTQPVVEALATGGYAGVFCCGPEPLMHAVADIAAEADTDCWISMEKRMACGIGACLSCVVNTVDGKRRSCVDGPVFNAKDVVW